MNRRHLKKFILGIPALCALALIAAGCAAIQPEKEAAQGEAAIEAQIVQEGDVAGINYVCRLTNSEIVAAVGAIPGNEKKSSIFVEACKSVPIPVLAVKPEEPISARPLGHPDGLEKEILERLARKLIGMQQGETRAVELTAQIVPPLDEKSGFARLAKTRTRPKEIKMSKQQYKAQHQKEPEIGQTLTIDTAFSGRVESVTGQDVVIRVIPAPGGVIKTPFGLGHIREEADHYKVDIDAHEGTLVRLGPLIGRIVSVTDKIITIDDRHPFGYETLTCDVTIVDLNKAGKPATPATPETKETPETKDK